MKEEKKRIAFKILLKILLAVPLTVIFILIRCVQFFLKLCGPVVSFVCILSSVVVSLGVLIEIILQIQGKGPGIAPVFLTMALAGGLAYVPVAGVGMVMVVLEAVCSWIWKFYMGNSDSLKAFYKRPDYKWSAFDESYRGGESNDSEVHIHYFKGIKNLEELKRRYGALLRIYHPVNDFGEDEITRSIVKEYHYLKDRFLEENKNSLSFRKL